MIDAQSLLRDILDTWTPDDYHMPTETYDALLAAYKFTNKEKN